MNQSAEKQTYTLQQVEQFLDDKFCDPQIVLESWFKSLTTIPELAPVLSLPPMSDSFWSAELKKAAEHPFFLKGLSTLIVSQINYEMVLTRLREGLLLYKPGLPKLARAMARQCELNGYVFYVTRREKEALESLGNTELERTIRACYVADKADVNWTGKSLAINDNVSGKVQEQYEESPYPIWHHIKLAEQKNDEPMHMLIAGCGTGRQAVSSAFNYPNAKITAVDLSRASLLYAQEKAREFGVSDRIEFIHGDLLNIEGAYDTIACTGVLHHMEDPDKGLQALKRVAKPGCKMHLAVYSKIARHDVNACKAYIRQRGYKAVPDDIREFRKDIITRQLGMCKDGIKRRDFYTLPECRDMYFHVQEHQYTIPTLREFLGDLIFDGCIVTQDIRKSYNEQFPGQPQTWENWEMFEHKYPKTFKNMYNVVVKVPD